MKPVIQKKPSAADQQVLKKSCVYAMVHGADAKGKPMFFYLAVAAEKWDAFKEALKKNHFDAKEYGMVLYSDYGKPGSVVQQTIEEYYGITLGDAAKMA